MYLRRTIIVGSLLLCSAALAAPDSPNLHSEQGGIRQPRHPMTYREWRAEVDRLLNHPMPVMRMIGTRMLAAGFYASRWWITEEQGATPPEAPAEPPIEPCANC